MIKRTKNSYLRADFLNTLRETSFFCCGKATGARAKYGNRHITGFVLSHERKSGVDPPTRKTQLSIITETGTGAPDRQFDKKSVFDF